MKYFRNQPLKNHTSSRIGGPADYLCIPKSLDDLREVILFAKEQRLPVSVMGAGTKLLVLDKGFRGLVIKLAKGLDWLNVKGSKVFVGSGVLIPSLLKRLASKGLGNLEFLAGIPGTIGGAVAMNAGAWGKEIGQYVEEVRVIGKNGKEKVLKKKALGFGYRQSKLQKDSLIIFEVVLRVQRKKKKIIKEKIKQHLLRRKENQPLGTPNCGSVFKNPKGEAAGHLIEEAGGKGLRIGDAQVSRKHANFIVNLGDAKAKDVIKLMTAIQKRVKDKFKIQLEPEIKIMIESAT